ncbi:MAG TPA: type II toxin-antitoxin system prevent-host-death family antitoxin [Kiritimatiellia bacterium]|nr:type II toxin-antitoxin system prevent-host-death family antitoxin [Kiritimatiellia bacterium]
MKTTIPAGEFKAKCLKLMDLVNEKQIEMTITKHGKAIAKLVPVEKQGNVFEQTFGSMAGTVRIVGDITEPIDVKWEAMEG